MSISTTTTTSDMQDPLQLVIRAAANLGSNGEAPLFQLTVNGEAIGDPTNLVRPGFFGTDSTARLLCRPS